MHRVAVLGGCGFLGSHAVDELLRAQYDVSILDLDSVDRWQGRARIVEASILSSEALDEVLSGCQAVFNFAALSDLSEAHDKAIETASVNVLGNAVALEAAHRAQVSKFIYASTVYVNSREGGFYRASKRAAEDYVREFQAQRQLNYVIARYGSLYGPRSDSRNGLHKIVRTALESGQITYAGDREALREYVHVRDAAAMTVDLLQPTYVNESVTITGMQRMRVLDALEMINEILGLSGEVKFTQHSQRTHYVRTPYAFLEDVSKKIVPSAHVDLGEGLLELVSAIQDEVRNENSPFQS